MLDLAWTVTILNDWDMASWVDDNDNIPLSTAQHCTGTLPFMAMELMVPNPPAHLYRHDLKSFFYILIWAALHYDFKNKTRASRVHPAIEEWNNSKMKSVHDNKGLLLRNSKDIVTIIAQIPLQCQALGPWIHAIWDLFYEGSLIQGHYEMAKRRGATATWDNKTYGGCITFEKFVGAVGCPI
ncbi:hypothetical protein DXG03_008706 [Asterophora parasitica]|uniref:Fungal-type protein kinase domain-containing protein n=1 Tax=Asterophora parasitica TaxID=117018 RepID=A0A9P7K7X2_9AGAR|nr:hypothetical protein DXG03_008706 [Asterophora parasitica]